LFKVSRREVHRENALLSIVALPLRNQIRNDYQTRRLGKDNQLGVTVYMRFVAFLRELVWLVPWGRGQRWSSKHWFFYCSTIWPSW